MSRRIPCGPLRADIEVVPKHVTIGEPLWTEGKDGKWYDQDGKEVEITTMSWEELMKMLSDH